MTLIKKRQLVKNKKNEQIDLEKEIAEAKKTKLSLKSAIEDKKRDLEVPSLKINEINAKSGDVDNLKTNLELVKNIKFPVDLVNTTNNRNKNNSLKKSPVSNNDLGKRKFTTLNLNKQNNKLDILKQAMSKKINNSIREYHSLVRSRSITSVSCKILNLKLIIKC
jgi:hypothetical protein